METFDQIFPHETIEKEWFGGSGAVQGKKTVVCNLCTIYKLVMQCCDGIIWFSFYIDPIGNIYITIA